MSATPALDQFLREKSLAGLAAIHSATAPVVGWYHPAEAGLGPASLEFGCQLDNLLRQGVRTSANIWILVTRNRQAGGSL